jgi:predicted transposase/invertase (TIGR01784 family)
MTDLTGITPFRQLPLSDNFMFAQVMRQPDICKLFLEELLGFPIAKLEFIGKEQDLSDSPDYHGVRLDVYANDANQTRYDIEMQNANQHNLELRGRYYHSAIDRNFLAKSMDYSKLPHSYVIFICDFDYFEIGLACYDVIKVIRNAKHLEIDDGSYTLILNSHYQEANVSSAIRDFLDYIRIKDDHYPYTSNLVKKAVGEMERLKADKDVGGAYMTWAMSMQDERSIGRAEGIQIGEARGIQIGEARGREQGIQIGEARGIISTLINLVMDRTLPYEIGREKSGLSDEEFQARIAEVDPNFQKQ